MSAWQTLLLVGGMGLVTYVTRRAFLQLPSGFFSPRLSNALSFIPVGIFAGLIFPSLFVDHKEIVIHPLFLIASVICLIIMHVTRNVFVSFGVSLALVVFVSLR